MESPNPQPPPLPAVLVSARDVNNAIALITDIIDEKSQEDQTNDELKGRVWHIVNKYYQADVELYPAGDGDMLPPSLAERLEAHIIYITDDEEGEAAAERAEERWSRTCGAWSRAQVRLVAVAGEVAPVPLDEWARRRRYEPVPLREAPDPGDDAHDEPFPDTYGLERVRASLHAHTWPGLEHLHPSTTALPPADYHSDGDEEGEDYVERAELFAEALGALGAVREQQLPDAERRLRAEQLLAVFCRALGTDLNTL